MPHVDTTISMEENRVREALRKGLEEYRKASRPEELVLYFSTLILVILALVLLGASAIGHLKMGPAVAVGLGALDAGLLAFAFSQLQALRACKFQCAMLETQLEASGPSALCKAIEGTTCARITVSLRRFTNVREHND